MGRKFLIKPAEHTPPRPPDEILAEIRRLYFSTTKATILRDFDRALDLLKSMPTPEDRQRATVFMEGLAEMRKEFAATGQKKNRRR